MYEVRKGPFFSLVPQPLHPREKLALFRTHYTIDGAAATKNLENVQLFLRHPEKTRPLTSKSVSFGVSERGARTERTLPSARKYFEGSRKTAHAAGKFPQQGGPTACFF
jgi:hypothetical protein